jgi:DNA-binding GntR family transcriptional regulator
MSRPAKRARPARRGFHDAEARPGGPDQAHLSDLTYERIKRDIVRCVLAPGTDITESQLGARYRTGKAPVRAALLRLRQDGLVRALARRGYSVSPITLQGVNDLFEMRILLEPGVARLASGWVSGERLRQLSELCTSSYTTGDGESEGAFLRANQEFHVSVAEATGNKRLAAATADLLDATERLVYLGLGMEQSIGELLKEHRLLLDAIAKGDGDGAAQIALAHVEASRKMVLHAIYFSRHVPYVSVAADS